jgi:phage baseplate assembly protein W
MAIDYGSDLSCLDDFDEEVRATSDPRTLIAQALIRRWMTPRGMLLDDPDYGTDLAEFMHDEVDELSLARMRAEARAEALKDERVVDCTITATRYTLATGTVEFDFLVECAETSLRLVVAVTDVSVSLLSVE